MMMPVLVVLLFAVCRYGLLFCGSVAVRNASAVGARQAIISSGNKAAITAVARNATAGDLPSDIKRLHVNVSYIPLTTGSGTVVKVCHDVNVIIPMVLPAFTGASGTNQT